MKRTGILVALLLIAVGTLYGLFLWNPVVFDDLSFFSKDKAGNLRVSSYHLSLFQLRSLPYATLVWSLDWFGLDLIYFRLENMLLHAGVTVVLFFFLRQLFAAVFRGRSETGLSLSLTAFFAALIFGLHPVATYAVGYLVQRTIVMATLFGLLAMLAYVHGSVRQKPLWLWMSVPLYYLAVLSKEHAIVLPTVLLALTLLLHDDWRLKLKQRWGIFLALAGIAVLVLLIKKDLLGSVYEPDALKMLQGVDSHLSFPLSVLTQSWLFFKYVGLWLFPNTAWMSIDMREPFAQSLLSIYFIAFMGFVVWGAVAIWLLLKRGWFGLIGFSLLFPWLMFFAELSTVRVQEPFVLYRSYLWMAGLCMLIPLLFLGARTRLTIASLSLICALMMFMAWERLTVFSYALYLWDDAARLAERKPYLPGTERIYRSRGIALFGTKLKQEALDDFSTAIRMSPDYGYTYNDRGAVYFGMKRYTEALQDFNTSIALLPSYANPYQGRGMVYEALGDIDRARESYKICHDLDKLRCVKVDELSKPKQDAESLLNPN